MGEDRVLVTGGSGFLGAHCIDHLLRAGYTVRTTIRSPRREAEVRAMLSIAGTPRLDSLSFAIADLLDDAGWADAAAGCRYIHHIASPFPAAAPRDERELIVPAREGTLRVLRAARQAGAERVVLTSSFVAVGYGHPAREAPFDETDWTNLEGPGVTAYGKSKTLAERAAWEFIGDEGRGLELAVVNPVGIFGPALGADYSTSVMIIRRLLDGFPFCPRIYFGTVDVRDVADLHLRAMTSPQANGERFLAVAGGLVSILDVANVLRDRLGAVAGRAPSRELPDWIVRALAPLIPDLRLVVPELGKRKEVTNEKAMRLLGWRPRSNEEAITATGESLVRLGLVK